MENIFKSYHTVAFIIKQLNEHSLNYRFYDDTLNIVHEGKDYPEGAYGFSITPKKMETDENGRVDYRTLLSGILYFHGPQAHKSELTIYPNCPSKLANIVTECLDNSKFPRVE